MDAGLVLLLVAYLFLRDRMPVSLWEQAPTLDGYLWGAMGPPVLDMLAMVAIVAFVMQRFARWPRLARVFAVAGLAAGAVALGRSLAPVVLDLRDAHPQEGIIVERSPGQVVIVQPSTRDPATSSLRLPNREQFTRVPDRMPVEFRVAPRLGVAQVVGVLE